MKSRDIIFETITVGALEVNCYIIGSKIDKDAIVIDAGGNPEKIHAILKKYGLNVQYILNTHAHFDHVGGVKVLQDLTGAKFLLHKDEIPLLNFLNEQTGAFGLPSIPKPDVYKTLNENDEISLGKSVFKVLHTPGHSPGSVCFLFDNAVFVGDTLFAGSIGRTDLYGGSHAKIIDSIKTRLFTLDESFLVYPGHGPFTTIREEKLHNPFFN